ncbi:MAG: lipid-A-disaccharide synthase [Legionellales bacterium]|nr:lipid-A-disaccharide synthase [Legionellales bacterium]
MTHQKPYTCLILAGEPSGDLHGAQLIQQLKQANPQLNCIGCGGDRMQAAGLECVMHIRHLSIMGFLDIVMRLPQLFQLWFRLLYTLYTVRPDIVILIDYPGFNLHFARYAHGLKIPVIYYIAPKVWASRPKRIQSIKRDVDHLAVIFPFEVDFFSQQGCCVDYVGNPLAEIGDSHDELQALQSVEGAYTIALLPGSRLSEWTRLYPLMHATLLRLVQWHSNIRFILAQHPQLSDQQVQSHPQLMITSNARAALQAADVALVASGTATLEAAMIGTPMVVTYQTSRLNAWLAQRILITPYISLPNILAGQSIVPEYLQKSATSDQLAKAIQTLLEHPADYQEMKHQLRQLREQLRAHPKTSMVELIQRYLDH